MLLIKDNDKIDNSSRDKNRPKHLLDFVRRSLIPSTTRQAEILTPKKEKEKRRQAEIINGGNKNNNKSCLRFVPPAAAAWARWLCLVGDPPKEVHRAPRIRCATELDKASVKFRKNKNPTSLTKIKFNNDTGVLTIPGIMIDHGTEIILRNLVAYEQFIDDYSKITEYAAFMDGLIDSREDVDLLQKNGIIESMLGDPTEVSRLFKNLLKDVAVPFWDTVPVRIRLEHYYNIRCHKWKASLMRNYFNSPWSFISLVAAITLLAFTFIQTFYAAIAYYH
ncbi:uncharacterized protein LOC122074194 [Macadamia integrifolia]|uniref:uncharacterized protein LOC122074194 n=1 Tax=Macadamia integrifolia TaxID=60698 RepID=UPI001C4F9DF9|nr:uncharacterized protein LOC122074194 [Macadamia integrifolia]